IDLHDRAPGSLSRGNARGAGEDWSQRPCPGDGVPSRHPLPGQRLCGQQSISIGDRDQSAAQCRQPARHPAGGSPRAGSRALTKASLSGATQRRLVGYSGVDLTLIEWPHRVVVRKQARHVAQSERLRQQARKLAWAHAAGFRCPAVRDDGIEDGLYWFDMDYIPGESLANGLISGRAIDWPKVVGQVAEVLLRFRAYADAMLDPATFVDKLADIRDRCAGRDVLR